MKKLTIDPAQLGQLFMVGLPGPLMDDSTRRLIRDERINNFILFKRNVEEPDQIRSLCKELTGTCRQYNLPPPFISIDQEGGSVTRLGPPFKQFADARSMADDADAETRLLEYARVCADDLLSVGINMNLAPVLDVCPTGNGFIMKRRSLGENQKKVAELGALIITEMQKKGVAACGKHFPGLGTAVLDPHHELPEISRTLELMRAVDFVPFQKAASVNVAAIMTSHVIYTELDRDLPATLSKKILTDLLRAELGFEGLIITDDLEMGAIEKEGPITEAALQAYLAGADVLLICHSHDKVRDALTNLKNALLKGTITTERAQTSLERMAAARNRFLPASAAKRR